MRLLAPRQGHNSAFPNTCQEVRRGVIGELLFWELAEQGRVGVSLPYALFTAHRVRVPEGLW